MVTDWVKNLPIRQKIQVFSYLTAAIVLLLPPLPLSWFNTFNAPFTGRVQLDAGECGSH